MKTKNVMTEVYFVTICAIMILVSVVFSGSYAFYSANVSEQGDNKAVTSQTKQLEDLVLSGAPSVAITNVIPGDEITTTFTVENPNDVEAIYSLYWSEAVNTFVNQSDLIVELSLDGDTSETFSAKTFPTAANEVLATNIHIPANTTQSFTLKITYQNTNVNQIEDTGKDFSGTISIKS